MIRLKPAGPALATAAIGCVCLAAPALAQSAPLPQGKAAQPEAQPVLACAALGSGFVNIPGTSSCLRTGLELFPELRSDFATKDFRIQTQRLSSGPIILYGTKDIAGSTDRFTGQPNGRVTLIAVTPISDSDRPLVSFISLRSGYDANAADERDRAVPGSGLGVEQAWVSALGVTAGLKPSVFDFSPGYNYTGAYASQRTTSQLAYELRLDNTASLTASLEDGRQRRYQDGVLANYGGQQLPDLVLRGRYEPSWGIVHAAGALHPIHDALADKRAVGWAVTAGLEYRQDWSKAFGDGAKGMYGRILVTGAYGEGALDYLGIPRFNSDYVIDADGRIVLSKGFSGLVSYEHLWTSRFKTAATLALYRTTATLRDFDWSVEGGVAQVGAEYNPTNGLYVGAQLAYYFDQAQAHYFEVPGSQVPVNYWQAMLYLRRSL